MSQPILSSNPFSPVLRTSLSPLIGTNREQFYTRSCVKSSFMGGFLGGFMGRFGHARRQGLA
jgi:hypothetical protein